MTDKIDADLEQLGSTLAEARDEVAAGRMVDLTDFAAQLRGVCQRIEAANRGESQRHIDTLLALRDELLRLAEGIHGILVEMTGPGLAGAATPPASGT